ncbi:MAG: hypothetical protein LBQ44_10955, partial [Treponema sp.]|nr:hypothetical protein [Treponema sp.]
MPYKKKVTILAVLTGVLGILYGFTLVFDPQRVSERNASFSWLSGEARDEADRIQVIRPGAEPLSLIRKNDAWYALLGSGQEVPAKQGRVDDIFRILSEKGAFPLRGSSPASHEELGLLPEGASRLIIRGGAGTVPLLDLLIGADDSSGREVFLRNNGENGFRSGDRLIATYVNGADTAWYNLRLFRDDLSSSVQRLRVSPLKNGEDDEDYVLARSGDTWVFEGDRRKPDGAKAAEWVKGLFDVQGDYFISGAEAPELSSARITVELGDGSIITILAGGVLP